MRNTKNKTIADHGDWLELDVSTPTHKNAVMSIDKEDWNTLLIGGLGRVHAYKAKHQKYLYANVKVKSIARRLHSLLLPDFEVVDHIDHDGLNNRRYNIRGCTQMENNKNFGLRHDNTSGVTGVGWLKNCNKWTASINCNKKTIWLGRFFNKEDAVNARKNAEREFFGEYAPTEPITR